MAVGRCLHSVDVDLHSVHPNVPPRNPASLACDGGGALGRRRRMRDLGQFACALVALCFLAEVLEIFGVPARVFSALASPASHHRADDCGAVRMAARPRHDAGPGGGSGRHPRRVKGRAQKRPLVRAASARRRVRRAPAGTRRADRTDAGCSPAFPDRVPRSVLAAFSLADRHSRSDLVLATHRPACHAGTDVGPGFAAASQHA